eukprot:snap_masked-scaffold_9-processed-gene-8.44-mRNA-1 protein AED:1.00 eAED:1.00 QI:0/-1/0/0/-1/1/1/0/154
MSELPENPQFLCLYSAEDANRVEPFVQWLREKDLGDVIVPADLEAAQEDWQPMVKEIPHILLFITKHLCHESEEGETFAADLARFVCEEDNGIEPKRFKALLVEKVGFHEPDRWGDVFYDKLGNFIYRNFHFLNDDVFDAENVNLTRLLKQVKA